MILKTTIISLGTLALLLIIRFTPLWDTILSSGTFKPVDFKSLVLPKRPNWILVCPEKYCTAAVKSHVAPTFDRSRKLLREQLKEIILSEGNAEVQNEAENSLDLIIRTPLLRWPDRVSIQYIVVSETQSTLAIFSRSIYGRSDLSVNKTRVKRWLTKLEAK